ncbi:hypothetical protein D3C76_834370 [compost metagenome]
MQDTISVVVDRIEFNASYIVVGDKLIITLPDGSQRRTELRGLSPESAAKPHLRSYAHDLKRAENR